MATKKIVKKAKKALKPVVKKKAAPAKKKAIAKKAARYACAVCGVSVTVDRFSGVALARNLICCGKVMKKK